MKGSKYRNYYCVVNESSEIYIDNTKCDNSTKPRAIKECYKTEGCKPEWVPLQWKEVLMFYWCVYFSVTGFPVHHFSVQNPVIEVIE